MIDPLASILRALEDLDSHFDPAKRKTIFYAVGREAAALLRERGIKVLTTAEASEIPTRGKGTVYYEILP